MEGWQDGMRESFILPFFLRILLYVLRVKLNQKQMQPVCET